MFKKMPFLRMDGDTIFLTSGLLEVYIPRKFTELKACKQVGNKYETYGYFVTRYFANGSTSGNAKFNIVTIPATIGINYSDVRNETCSFKENPDIPADDYIVLTLKEGDIFINSIALKRDAKNAGLFIDLLHKGKLPKFVNYFDLPKLYLGALSMSGVGLGVRNETLEMIIAALYREMGKPENAYRKYIKEQNGKVTGYDCEATSLKNLAMVMSTFTAVTFENINQAIVTSVNKAVNNIEETISPVERIIKY